MKYIIAFCVSISITFVYSQSQISGKIIDSKGEPVFGVNVTTDRLEGTVTDFDGNYNLVVKQGALVLKLSGIGYKTQNKEVIIEDNQKLVLNFSIENEDIEVEDVIVYGSKRGKLLQEEIQSVEVIKAELLQNNNVTDGIQAVNLLSGVTVLDGQMSIRGGSGYAYGVGSRVILVQDEVPSLTPERDEINWDFIPTENVEQIELLKGGGGVQYGSSALNGVLNVRSAWAKEIGKPETEVTFYNEIIGNPKVKEANWWKDETTYFQTPHTLGVTFAHRRKMKKNFDLTISGMGHSFQSHLKEEFNERARINVNFRHRPTKIDGLSYGMFSKYMFRNDSFFFIWEDNKEGKYKPSAVYGRRYHYTQLQPFFKYYDKKGNSFKYNGSVYYDSMAEKDADNSSLRVYNDLQYNRKFKFGLDLLAGLTIDNRRVYAPALRDIYFPDDINGAFKFENYATYLTLDYKYKNLSLSAGGRNELIGLEGVLRSSKPTFFIGANYKVTKNDYLRFSISQSFRLPNVAEKFVDESLGQVNIYSNPDIQPETGYNAELGYKRMLNFDKKWRGFFDFAFFWTEFENMVEFSFNDYTRPEDENRRLGFMAVNVDRARIFGWEVNVEERYKNKNFEIAGRFGYTYAYGADLTANFRNKNIGTFLGNAFAGVAVTNTQHKRYELNTSSYQPRNPLYGILKYRFRHTIKMDLNAKYKRFGLGVNLAYYSYMDNVDEIFLLRIEGVAEDRAALNYKGTAILNLRAMYEVENKVLFSFLVKNVANNDYAIRPSKPNAPRSYTFQTKFLF